MITPNIKINLSKLEHNAKHIKKLCKKHNITPFAVTKVLSGDIDTVKKIVDCGFEYIGESRIDNLEKFQSIPVKKVLLRSTIPSEIKKVISYSDLSLESEIAIIEALNIEAKIQNKIHDIILMFDLGDLREGIFFTDDYLPIVREILNCPFINLKGIGTNLTCYGGIIPTEKNLQMLIDIKNSIENNFSIKIDIVSGGNSSSLYLLENNRLPLDVNNLRIGEAIFLARETAYGKKIPEMYDDVFELSAEIIELKNKPSMPIGTSNMNAFGEIVKFTDKGIIKRGILPLGKQDISLENVLPQDKNITVLGQSSDHLLLDLTNTNYYLGDTLSFNLNYQGLLQVMTSPYIKKIHIT